MLETTNEAGQTTVEYTLVVALAALVFGFALHALDVPFGNMVGRIASSIVNAL